jgi:hypothetical protein
MVRSRINRERMARMLQAEGFADVIGERSPDEGDGDHEYQETSKAFHSTRKGRCHVPKAYLKVAEDTPAPQSRNPVDAI